MRIDLSGPFFWIVLLVTVLAFLVLLWAIFTVDVPRHNKPGR